MAAGAKVDKGKGKVAPDVARVSLVLEGRKTVALAALGKQPLSRRCRRRQRAMAMGSSRLIEEDRPYSYRARPSTTR